MPPENTIVPDQGEAVATDAMPQRIELAGIDSCVLMHRGIPVGEIEDGEVTIDLGWARLARLGVFLRDDPKVDSHRGGFAFSRPIV